MEITDIEGSINELHQQLGEEEAELVRSDGQFQVKYMISENRQIEVSQSGIIVAPKANINEVIDRCLEGYEASSAGNALEGVLLDPGKIWCNQTYREEEDYEVSDKKLGNGLNGPIVVVRDKTLGLEHALKKVRVTGSTLDEIKLWTELEDCNDLEMFPFLYLFHREGNQILFHYEILDKAYTIRDIIENSMLTIRENPELLHHLSLHVLNGLLEASSEMHHINWLHGNLHGEHVMLQAKPDFEIKVCVLGFGSVKRLDERRTITKDMQEIIRVFTSVYVAGEFTDTVDLKNIEKILSEGAQEHKMSGENQTEFLNLIEKALNVHMPVQEIELMKEVNRKLKESLVEKPDVMQKIFELIFPVNFSGNNNNNIA